MIQLRGDFIFGYTKKVQKLHIFYKAFPEIALCFVQGEFFGKQRKGPGKICKNCWRSYLKSIRRTEE